MPAKLDTPPPESELEAAEAILGALGSGAPVNPALPDEGPGLLIKAAAAFRDDIEHTPSLLLGALSLTHPAQLD